MTAPAIAGKLVSPRTWAKAAKVGHWGYFYENTWLDLYLTGTSEGFALLEDGRIIDIAVADVHSRDFTFFRRLVTVADGAGAEELDRAFPDRTGKGRHDRRRPGAAATRR